MLKEIELFPIPERAAPTYLGGIQQNFAGVAGWHVSLARCHLISDTVCDSVSSDTAGDTVPAGRRGPPNAETGRYIVRLSPASGAAATAEEAPPHHLPPPGHGGAAPAIFHRLADRMRRSSDPAEVSVGYYYGYMLISEICMYRGTPDMFQCYQHAGLWLSIQATNTKLIIIMLSSIPAECFKIFLLPAQPLRH